MNFYDFTQIKAAADCAAVARDFLGMQVSPEGRCAATWRGGGNPESVSINKDGWHDFATEESGSVIDLVARVRCGGNIMEAQELLGVYLHLSPKMATKTGCIESNEKYDRLIASGYREVKRYSYTDASGALVNQVVRLEHPTQKKEFLQCTPRGWGLRDVIPPLYNLPMLRISSWALLVEGEKDADNLIALNLPATTVCGGAKKWRDEYTQEFDGKDVAILPDNDDPGRDHARMIAHKLIARGRVNSVRIVPTSTAPKGDVSDFFAEGHTWDDVARLIAAAPALTAEELAHAADEFNVEEAKAANATPFRNFTPTVNELPNGAKKTVKTPRQINKLIEDINRRFLGFPRKVGEKMFDHDRDSRRIVYIDQPAEFFAWIQRKSNQLLEWSREEGCVTKEELFQGSFAAARRYEAISFVPDWPLRDDVYYAYGELPPPDPDHKHFKKLVDFFEPASDEYRVLIMAMIAAPLFYVRGVPRPVWIIDSIDGAGSGKTKLVEAIAELYGSAPISTNKNEVQKQFTELTKRIVSSAGRQSRILLLDNVTGTFSCPEFADMATKSDITGRPAYGCGEEVRPNNLIYAITTNGASVDNDIASRGYYIYLRKPAYSPHWLTELFSYVREYRLNILVDLIDILDKHTPFNLPPVTRCPEFETRILQAFCRDTDEYSDVIKIIARDKSETNNEEELAKQIEEVLRYHLIEVQCTPRINPDRDQVFIRSDVLTAWLENESDAWDKRNIVQAVRNMANTGILPIIDKKIKRFPNNGELRRSGVLWSPPASENSHVVIIGKIGNGKIGMIHNI